MTPTSVLAGGSVAVIGGGGAVCQWLTEAGFDCVTFPGTGPDTSLEPFDVVVDLSAEWTDPDGLLADVMRAGKGVITWDRAPLALGIDSDPVVQAWIGANAFSWGTNVLVTLTTDPILGGRPLFTIIGDCADAFCRALADTSGHPDTKVLAAYDGDAASSIGVLRNRWDGGQSVYFTELITGFDPGPELFVNAVRELTKPPIPAVSDWGLVILTLLLLTAGSIVITRRRTAAWVPHPSV